MISLASLMDESLQIAWDYLERTGEIEDACVASCCGPEAGAGPAIASFYLCGYFYDRGGPQAGYGALTLIKAPAASLAVPDLNSWEIARPGKGAHARGRAFRIDPDER